MILLLALVRSFNHPAYRHRLGERLGLVPSNFKRGGIVIHGASVGEILALKPFINECLQAFNDVPITVTTFTPTGSEQVQKIFGDRVQHCYLPLDIWPCSTGFLNALQPSALVVMETELWPNLVAQAKQRGTKLLLINGRISDKSIGRYEKFSALIRPCLARFDQVLAQSELNQQRLIHLGANAETCHNVGNLKYDIKAGADTAQKYQVLSPLLNVERPIWLLASSHEGDEAIALAAYRTIAKQYPDLLLVVVPRHPERFDKVVNVMQQQQISVQRRSDNLPISANTQVCVMDSLGELLAAYQFADIVTIGGTFSHIGGHNPLEPALYQKPIIVGADMANFVEVHQQMSDQQGLITLAKTNDDDALSQALAEQVVTLLGDESTAAKLGRNAYQVVQANQGCCERTFAALNALLNT